MDQRFKSFDEFWPFYVREHSKKLTRQLHFAGTSAALSCAAVALFTRHKWLGVVAPVAGYGPAWLSHFLVEKNRPATFKYPMWSLMADFVMWSKMLAGTMDAEVEAVLAAVSDDDDVLLDEDEIVPNMATDGTLH